MLNVKLKTGRAGFVLVLQGALDGPVSWPSFDALPTALTGGLVIVDCGGVPEVSPAGVDALLRGLQSVPAKRRLLVNVRPALLSAVALFPGAIEMAGIGSAWLPLVCIRCQRAQEQLLDLRLHEVAARTFGLPPFACTGCQGPCGLDDDALVLFSPFAEQPPLHLPDGIDAFWPPPRAAPTSRTQVELDVAGAVDVAVTAVWLSGTLAPSPSLARLAPRLDGTLIFVDDGVHATTAAGLEALRDLLGTLPAWIARLSPVLAEGLATTVNGWGSASVVSMRLPFRCESCGDTVLVDVDLDERERLASELPPLCPRCSTVLARAFSERDQLSLDTLPLLQPPPEVAAYLESHLHPPSRDRQSEWTQVASEQAPAVGAVDADRRADPSAVPALAPSGVPDFSARPPTTGRVQGTRYEITRRLGVGGMAETLLGRQTGIGGFEKRVVIKRILPSLAAKPDFIDMFLHEARIAARINHSNVVQIFDFGRARGEYYIVMEYVKGYDLAAILKTSQTLNRPIPIELAIRMVADLCGGLAAAHTARDDHGNLDPIIHRDVSPHNVLISADGATKLADFGIAKPQSHVGQTQPGELKGKIVYMAPEALRNEPPTIKLDIYAAGLILYTLLAGKNPYTRASEIQSMYAVAHEGLPPIITQRRDVPFTLAATLGRAVNRDPAARFPSAQALQLHLEAFLGELGRPATPMHLALWVNELMATQPDKPSPMEGTPSSSLELLDIGGLGGISDVPMFEP